MLASFKLRKKFLATKMSILNKTIATLIKKKKKSFLQKQLYLVLV